ncbi:MAG TPA: molecular chaperone DnaK, partial [Streptosporangiaceae bacterium]|nr:molecular chaperone DnaK [Streptosporangiaceae bacterium]
DTDAIRTATENAAQVSQKMGTAIYAQSQAANAAGGQAGGGADAPSDASGDEDVVDAEIVEDEKPGAEGGAAR